MTRIRAILTAAALAGGMVLLSATPASATDPANLCGSGSGTDIDIFTGTALWNGVCENAGDFDEATTANKSDSVDGMGHLYINEGLLSEVEIGAPAADTTVNITEGVGGEISFTDYGVVYAPGDLVDVAVTRFWAGTTTSWTITVTDADDDSPRPDVAVTFTGNLGSDGDTIFTVSPNAFVSYGDPGDPINMFSIDAPSYTPALSGDGVDFDVTTPATITMGLVDYDCTNYDDAVTLGVDSVDTLEADFGTSYQVPGTDPCFTIASPIHLTQGQPFDVPLTYTYRAGGFDFTNGGTSYLWWSPDFLDYEVVNENVAGVAPGLRVVGEAPAEPGEYWVVAAVDTNEDPYASESHWVRVIVGPPTLPATGVDAMPLLVVAGALMLAGVVVVGSVRRRGRSAA